MGSTLGTLSPWKSSDSRNKQAISETRKHREERIQKARTNVEGQDERKRNQIVALKLTDLADALRQEIFTPTEVLHAYTWKALEADKKCNCLQEFLLESFGEAEELYERYKGREDKPPLYGLPFSVKGNLFVKGYDCCIGLAQWLDKPVEEDCTLITHLRSLGAIPFVITNVPQMLYAFVCSNPVYGTTLNPHNTERTVGGSSGGEACLVAAGGTPFGTGSDIAGSLRIPASFCGTVSLKCGQERLILENLHGGLPGFGRLSLGYGFFTKRVEDQAFLLQHTLGVESYNKLVLRNAPVPFNHAKLEEAKASRGLRIGYYLSDGFVPATPGCARVIEHTVERLKEMGHELVRFEVPEPNKLAKVLVSNIFPEGGELFLRRWATDIVDEHMRPMAVLLSLPNCLKWLVSKLVAPISPQAAAICSGYNSTPADVRQSQEDFDDYVSLFHRKWKEAKLDALVCPAFTIPAPEHKWPAKLAQCGLATALFNVVDFVAGVVPAGVLTEEDNAQLMDESKWRVGSNFILKDVRAAAANSTGLPLSVQVVTPPYGEEMGLGLMTQIQTIWTEVNKKHGLI